MSAAIPRHVRTIVRRAAQWKHPRAVAHRRVAPQLAQHVNSTPRPLSATPIGLPQPEHPRLLGHSRPYTAADFPQRLRQWHAPRINRWERLRVTAGTLGIEYLDAAGVTAQDAPAGSLHWFPPGTRWRVARMPPEGRFELEVHADVRGQAEAPQPLRSELLEHARRVAMDDAAALVDLIDAMPADAHCIAECRFDASAALTPRLEARTLFWHPLAAGRNGVTALLARSERTFNLAAYLGRDHAVIEAALGGALAGDAECLRWLRATLERHLHIEEELVFPAYLAAGGRDAWIDGLKREHVFLRQYLRELDDARSRRKFLRLLDGHDEKEERVIYPDVLARTGRHADVLLVRALAFPIPALD